MIYFTVSFANPQIVTLNSPAQMSINPFGDIKSLVEAEYDPTRQFTLRVLYTYLGLVCAAFVGFYLAKSKANRAKVTPPVSPPPPPPIPSLRRGSIHLIMGPMFSGKTRELKRRVDVKRIASERQDRKCLLIKFSKDTRYDARPNVLATHNLMKDEECIGALSLAQCDSVVQYAQYIFIDEGQFFPELTEHCLKWAREGREVHVAALDAYASQEMWPEVAKLIPWCVSLQKLNAVCGVCGSDASLTITNAGRPANKSEAKIGGKDLYNASCIMCCDQDAGRSPKAADPPIAAAPVELSSAR